MSAEELQVQIKDTTTPAYECDRESLMSLVEEYTLPIFDETSLLTERSEVHYEETEKGSRTVTVYLTEQGEPNIDYSVIWIQSAGYSMQWSIYC